MVDDTSQFVCCCRDSFRGAQFPLRPAIELFEIILGVVQAAGSHPKRDGNSVLHFACSSVPDLAAANFPDRGPATKQTQMRWETESHLFPFR
jgi:hypothetical protein